MSKVLAIASAAKRTAASVLSVQLSTQENADRRHATSERHGPVSSGSALSCRLHTFSNQLRSIVLWHDLLLTNLA